MDIQVPSSLPQQISSKESKILLKQHIISIFQFYINIKWYQHRIKRHSNFMLIQIQYNQIKSLKKMEEEYVGQQLNLPVRTTIQTQELLAKRKLTKKPKKKKKSYDIIPYEKRVELLDLILNQKETIKSSANKLGIKLCTAKHILYLYKNQGKIHERKQDQQCSDSQWSEPRQYKKPGLDKKQLSEKLENSQLLFISQSFSQKNQSTPKQNKKDEEQLKQLQNSGKKTQVGSQQQTEKEKKENNVSICYVPIPVPIFNLMGEASLESLLASWPWNLNLLNDSFNI